jgi:hypothetical protein
MVGGRAFLRKSLISGTRYSLPICGGVLSSAKPQESGAGFGAGSLVNLGVSK